MSLPGYIRARIASMDSGCGVGVAVGIGVAVGVSLGIVVGRGVKVEVGEADGVGEDAFVPQATRIKDRMIQDSMANFIRFILSL